MVLNLTFIKAHRFVIDLVSLQNAVECEERWWGPDDLDTAGVNGSRLHSLWWLTGNCNHQTKKLNVNQF